MIALSVAVGSALLALGACALSAFYALRASRAASALRSMSSLQDELIEIRDHLVKVDRWAKRIHQRDVMTERRASEREPGKSSQLAFTNDKDELRRRAGLLAGHAARHTNGSIDE